uniref:Uncharacterized protein n=1 Tax=Aegilops tauschii subsp. strangulata TaxID=200361 RepID=A0A453CP51_AEGTS
MHACMHEVWRMQHARSGRAQLGHWKPEGTFLPQLLRTRLRAMGKVRLMPRRLRFSVVHRHSAASRSASPWISEQHGCTGGLPRVMFSSPSTFAHTPSFSASSGHWVLFPPPPLPPPPFPPPPFPPPPFPPQFPPPGQFPPN